MISMRPEWWIRRWAELSPEKAAVIFEGRQITYRELQASVEATAAWLHHIGIEKGDRIAILMKNCPEVLDLFLASGCVGAVFVPLNFRLTEDELRFLIGNSRPRLVVYSSEYAGVIDELDVGGFRPAPTVAYVGETPDAAEPAGHIDFRTVNDNTDWAAPVGADAPADAEDAQVIMYTSGTTGHPKGAVLSHRKTFFNCLNADMFFDLVFEDCMLIVLPMFHSGGLFIQAAPCLYKGATIVLHSRFDPERVLEDIHRYGVTKFLGVPTIYRGLLGAAAGHKGELASLAVCAIGGERVTPDIIRKCWDAGFPVRQVMGQTETSILLWASEQELLDRPDTVGRPVFHAEVRLVRETGKEADTGEVGEIVVRGSILMNEYWRSPAETARALAGGWLHTGDLARKDSEGYFFLVDRAKDMYISGGENVYPAEVERVLREHPHVSDVAVVGVPDETWGEVGHAFIIVAKDAHLSEDDVLGWCRGKLARYKIPRRVTFCEDFPRTGLGKTRKFLLAEMAREGATSPERGYEGAEVSD